MTKTQELDAEILEHLREAGLGVVVATIGAHEVTGAFTDDDVKQLADGGFISGRFIEFATPWQDWMSDLALESVVTIEGTNYRLRERRPLGGDHYGSVTLVLGSFM